MRVVIEAQEPQNSGSLFRVVLNGEPIGDGLTAAQAHLLTGDVLEMFVMPGRSAQRGGAAPGDDARGARRRREADPVV